MKLCTHDTKLQNGLEIQPIMSKETVFNICKVAIKLLYKTKTAVERLILRLQFVSISRQSQFRAYCLFHRNSSTAIKNNRNMGLMLEINKKILKLPCDAFISDKKMNT